MIGLSYTPDTGCPRHQRRQHLEGRRVLALLEQASPERNEALIRTEPSGRPYFSDRHADFNISHSRAMAAVSLSTGRSAEIAQLLRTGCDIQFVNPQKSYGLVMRRFFKPEEQEYSNTAPTAFEKSKRFIQIWALKESFIKLRGLSIADIADVPAFTVTGAAADLPGAASLAFSLYTLGGKASGCYILALARDLPLGPPEFRWFSPETLPIQDQACGRTL